MFHIQLRRIGFVIINFLYHESSASLLQLVGECWSRTIEGPILVASAVFSASLHDLGCESAYLRQSKSRCGFCAEGNEVHAMFCDSCGQLRILPRPIFTFDKES